MGGGVTNEYETGFERTERRANSIIGILDSSDDPSLPSHFWQEVDELTIRLLTMLLPLLDVMDANFPESRAKPLIEIHQALHSCIAEAGYMSLAMRCQKRTIVRFNWPDVGDTWDLQMNQDQEAAGVYAESKALLEEEDDVDRLLGKVKVVLWPSIDTVTRVKPDEGFRSGTFTTKVMKSQVIFYAGYDGGENELLESEQSLEEYVQEVVAERRSWPKRVLARSASCLRVLAWRWFAVFAFVLIVPIVGLGLLEREDGTTVLVSRVRCALGWVLDNVWGRPADLPEEMPWIKEELSRSTVSF